MSTQARKITDNSQGANVFNPGEKLFRALIENSSDAVALVSHEGLFTYVSPSVQKILGFTPEELLGRNTLELFPPDNLPAALEQYDSVARTPGLTVTVEHTCIHKDGSLRWLESTTTNHLHDPTIQGFVANFRDITERKKLQDDMWKSEQQLQERQHILDRVSNLVVSSLDQQITLTEIAQLLVPSLADYCRIAVLDEQHQIQEIAVNHADPAKVALVQALYDQYKDRAEPIYGVQKLLRTGKPELISNLSQDVLAHVQVHPDMLNILGELALKSYMGVPLIARDRIIGAMTFSSVQTYRQYTEADLRFAGELARRIALALDNIHLYQQAQAEIRERKKVEEALRESEAHKGAVFDTALDSIITMDHTGRIVEFNPAAERTFGYRRDEVVGQNMAELIIPPSLHERHKRGLAHYLATGEGAVMDRRIEIVAMRQDGSEFPIELAVTRVPKEGFPLFTGTIRDITERKELEQRKDEFISMASHELKTPVTSLKGFTHLLQRRLAKQGDGQALHFLDRIEAQLNKLTKLISDLLDVTKMQTGKLEFREERFSLDELVRETLENLQGTTETHRFRLEEVRNAQVFGDKDRLGQVLINLLTNAIKYSPQADAIIVRVSTDEHGAIVCVQDFGIGIAETHQEKIFERFYQVNDATEKTFSGLGIGLYISNEIVRRHHGRLWVKSAKGAGATFYVSLPLARED
jgi:PAS domain S-box-containing protein